LENNSNSIDNDNCYASFLSKTNTQEYEDLFPFSLAKHSRFSDSASYIKFFHNEMFYLNSLLKENPGNYTVLHYKTTLLEEKWKFLNKKDVFLDWLNGSFKIINNFYFLFDLYRIHLGFSDISNTSSI
jgi:hypothetical protein